MQFSQLNSCLALLHDTSTVLRMQPLHSMCMLHTVADVCLDPAVRPMYRRLTSSRSLGCVNGTEMVVRQHFFKLVSVVLWPADRAVLAVCILVVYPSTLGASCRCHHKGLTLAVTSGLQPWCSV
jgi:hypothetical protein